MNAMVELRGGPSRKIMSVRPHQLPCLVLDYGDTLPARVLYRRLFRSIRSAKEICGLVESGEA